MKTAKHISQLLQMSHFRRDKIKLFRDFVELSALSLSITVDPVHRIRHSRRLDEIQAAHTQEELAEMTACLRTLTEEILEKADAGLMEDILGRAYEEHNLCEQGQDFTFSDVGRLISTLGIIGDPALPKCGFFDLYESACGSGAIVLSAAELLQSKGFDWTKNLVVYANDTDEMCVHMAYLQISLQGIPAVVARANTITGEEFERWYTPQYVLGRWIMRRSFEGNHDADFMLKCSTIPHYATVQQALMLEHIKNDIEGDDLI